MMMPPKKSKAARGVAQAQAEEDEKAASSSTNGQAAAPQEKEGEEDEDKHINIFTETVVEGKRKRLMPVGEQKLNDWLSEHFEEKEDAVIKLQHMYEAFVEFSAQIMNAFTVEESVFQKIVKARFPKGYAVKEDSVYRATLKEKKAPKVGPKVQADSLKLKMKDIITKAIQDLGNPSKGLRFSVLKNHLAMRYPALRLEFNPGQLMTGLFNGVRSGTFERVRGLGKMGFYRLPGPALIEEKVEEKKKKKVKEGVPVESVNQKEKPEGAEADKVEDDAGEKADDEQEKEGGKKKTKKLTKKRKKDAAKEESSATEEDKPEGEAGAEGDKEKTDNKDKKKKKKKPAKKPVRRFIVHSDPQRVDDCFQLAFTYMTEPKEASTGRIRNYVHKYYPGSEKTDIYKVLDQGVEKGFWELVRGTIKNGTFRLLLDEVDCSADDDTVGQICNAIMATVEPKLASALLIKRYIIDYHPTLNVADRPHLFKRALEKAVNNGTLSQLTGIGSIGSFKLVQPFIPNPIILAGRDTSSDYESDAEMDNKSNDDISAYANPYQPRPSKSRGKGRSVSREGKPVLQGEYGEPAEKKFKIKEEEVEPEVYYDAYKPRPTSRGLGRGPAGQAPLITKAAKKARPVPPPEETPKSAGRSKPVKKEAENKNKKTVASKNGAKGKGKAQKKKGGKKK